MTIFIKYIIKKFSKCTEYQSTTPTSLLFVEFETTLTSVVEYSCIDSIYVYWILGSDPVAGVYFIAHCLTLQLNLQFCNYHRFDPLFMIMVPLLLLLFSLFAITSYLVCMNSMFWQFGMVVISRSYTAT